MSNEIQVQASLQVTNSATGRRYQSQPTAFKDDYAGTRGPVPGSVLVSTGGTTVDLTGLSGYGGYCFMQNLDATNYVEYGIYAGGTFYPLGKLGPTKHVIFQLSPHVRYGASGTAVTQELRLKANTAACVVLVEAFDP